MIHIDCAGTAYEIGKQHAESCPDAVRTSYSAWAPTESPDAKPILSGISTIEKGLNKHFPEILEEMQGIADGADLSLEQIMCMNLESELVSEANALPSCSNIGFKRSDQGVLIGKTADWYPDNSHEFTLAQRYTPDANHGYEFFHFGCVGTLWSEGGLNKSGLAMVLNGLPTWGGAQKKSVPALALSRGVLQWCRDVQDAVEWLQRYDVFNWGFNLTLADAAGALCYVEVAPGTQAVHYPTEDYVLHTNHCLQAGPLAQQIKPETTEMIGYPDLLANSESRYQTLVNIVPNAPRSLEAMESILRHRSAEGSISQAGESHGLKTVYAMIVAPQTQTLWGTEGFPPDGPFNTYKL